MRVRGCSDASQQSANTTIVDFGGNDTGNTDFNLDKWYLAASKDNWWSWAGRNSVPFWKRNAMFWDDDVIPAGLTAGYRGERWGVNAGYFSLPVGMQGSPAISAPSSSPASTSSTQ